MNLRQRQPRYQNRALLDACYLIPCTADWPHECLGQSEPSHSNLHAHGKCAARKSHDVYVASLCRNAHRDVDEGRGKRAIGSTELMWQRAFESTLLELWRRGLVAVTSGSVCEPRLDDSTQTPAEGQRQSAHGPSKSLRRSRKTLHANGRSTESPSKVIKRDNVWRN